MKRLIRLFFYILILGLFFVPATVSAKDSGSKTVRVGYPISPGLTDINQNGDYSGYTYEYLEEISQYTGWNYEFVQIDGDTDKNLSTCMTMLEKGEIDLLGNMPYTDAFKEKWDYSSHSYGTVDTVLQALSDDAQTLFIDSQTPVSYRIAVIDPDHPSVAGLEEYCRMNNITPEYIVCSGQKELLEALRNDTADLILNSSVNYIEGVRTVASFSPEPFYFAASKNSGIINELNSALLSIQSSSPLFADALYDKYFSPGNGNLLLTPDEHEYIRSAPTLVVGLLKNQPPYQYIDSETDSPSGISVNMLEYIADSTGLKFKYKFFNSPKELYEAAENSKVALVAGLPYDYALANKHNLSLSQVYISSQYAVVLKGSVNEKELMGKRLAISSSTQHIEPNAENPIMYNSTSECIQAVEDGDADYCYADVYTAQYFTSFAEYDDLKVVTQPNTPRKVCFGVCKPIDRELLSVLNKCILTISEEDLQLIIYQNAFPTETFSLKQYIQEYPVITISSIAAVFLFIIALLLLILRQRIQAVRHKELELKKHFQVYALANEQFFEYSFKEKTLIISTPSADGIEPPAISEYNFSKPYIDRDQEEQKQAFLKIIQSQDSGVVETQTMCGDGKLHWLRIVLKTIYDGNTPVYALGKIHEIDKEKEEKEDLLAKAQRDSLTQSLNAGTVKKRVGKLLKTLNDNEYGALLLIDVDHFKSINDTYGHMTGDSALVQLADLLRTSFRSEDIVGRPGGDEFIVYMKTVRDIYALEDKCASLCSNIRKITSTGNAPMTISIGAVTSCKDDTYEILYHLADRALYTSKRRGRDQYVVISFDQRDEF